MSDALAHLSNWVLQKAGLDGLVRSRQNPLLMPRTSLDEEERGTRQDRARSLVLRAQV
jgi:hypothetical protein